MEVRILGPVAVEIDGRSPHLGPQQRALLAALALEAGRALPASRLVTLLWGDSPPGGAATTVRSHVLHLRRVLEPGRGRGKPDRYLVTEPAGYALRLGPGQLDTDRFEEMVDLGTRALGDGDARTAAEQLTAALGLWRGPALADVADRPFAGPAITRLARLRQAAERARLEARLALGRHHEMIGELEETLADHPDDEAVRRMLALALYRVGRVRDGARVCRDGLTLLHGQGVDSVTLQALQRDIMRGAPELDWRPAAVRPYQLPADIAEFRGRAAEQAAVRARLAAAGRSGSPVVVAIDGVPGVGKSALATHLAHELAAWFRDGVLYADLHGTDPHPLGPQPVLARFLRSLGVEDHGVPADLDTATARFRALLMGRSVLLVLDDVADAAQVRPLLPAGPGSAVLVTSRAPLAGLDGAVPLTLGVLSDADAVLALEAFAGPGRVAAEPAAARRVARRCGRLPLALRLAGAQSRLRPAWPLTGIADALAAGARGTRRRPAEPVRGDPVLRSALQLTYRALPADQRRALRLLGLLDSRDVSADVLAELAGCEPAAAEATLDRLAAARLLEPPSGGRYHPCGPVRAFAREQVEAEEPAGVRRAALRRVYAWYLARVRHAAEILAPEPGTGSEPGTGCVVDSEIDSEIDAVTGSGTRTAGHTTGHETSDRYGTLGWLESERANLVALARQAAAQPVPSLAMAAWELDTLLRPYFRLRTYWTDWQAVSEAAVLAARRFGNGAAEARALVRLGGIHRNQHRPRQAMSCFQRGLVIAREVGDRRREGAVLRGLGEVYRDLGRHREAIGCLERSLAISRELGGAAEEASGLGTLGNAYREIGDYGEAAGCLERGLTLSRELGDRRREAATLGDLAMVHLDQTQYEEAVGCFQRSLTISRDGGDRYNEATALWGLGRVACVTHDTARAHRHLRAALEIFSALGAAEAEEVRSLLGPQVGHRARGTR